MFPVSPHKSGVVLALRLTPNAAKNLIKDVTEDSAGNKHLNVRVTVVPEKGKANQAVIKLLSKSLGIAKSDFEIIRGETDRNKQVLIRGNTDQLISQLSKWLSL